MESNEIVLSVTPVTSDLEEPIEYRTFGSNTVGLPKVSIREINTTVRMKSGDMLVIGGLIDSSDATTNKKVPLLGDIPFLNRLFGHEAITETKKELVILLQAKII
jgi:general secretion pathway protein D/MSHA biogenesis protein MshL